MQDAHAPQSEWEAFHEDVSLLSCRLAGAGVLSASSDLVRLDRVHDVASFHQFALDYVRHLLIPVELPAIIAASECASRSAFRELLELDHQLAQEPVLKLFAEASRALGRHQLRKLRGLRDVRLLARYRTAVMDGAAYGWHLLVYGVVLSLFSMPLRQGLAKYQIQVLRGFGQSVCHSLQWSESQWQEVQENLEAIPLPSLEQIAGSSPGTPTPFSIV